MDRRLKKQSGFKTNEVVTGNLASLLHNYRFQSFVVGKVCIDLPMKNLGQNSELRLIY